jgi:hypothetical protein
MTVGHAMQDGLDTVSAAEALGSLHLYVHEAALLFTLMHGSAPLNALPNGTVPLKVVPQDIRPVYYAPDYFQLDPVAVAGYASMVQSLQTAGARIVYIVPPLYEGCRQLNIPSLAAYKDAMQRTLPPAPIVDLDGPDLDAFRNDKENYVDCFHVNAAGAAKINAYLAQLIPQALSSAPN